MSPFVQANDTSTYKDGRREYTTQTMVSSEGKHCNKFPEANIPSSVLALTTYWGKLTMACNKTYAMKLYNLEVNVHVHHRAL